MLILPKRCAALAHSLVQHGATTNIYDHFIVVSLPQSTKQFNCECREASLIGLSRAINTRLYEFPDGARFLVGRHATWSNQKFSASYRMEEIHG